MKRKLMAADGEGEGLNTMNNDEAGGDSGSSLGMAAKV